MNNNCTTCQLNRTTKGNCKAVKAYRGLGLSTSGLQSLRRVREDKSVCLQFALKAAGFTFGRQMSAATVTPIFDRIPSTMYMDLGSPHQLKQVGS